MYSNKVMSKPPYIYQVLMAFDKDNYVTNKELAKLTGLSVSQVAGCTSDLDTKYGVLNSIVVKGVYLYSRKNYNKLFHREKYWREFVAKTTPDTLRKHAINQPKTTLTVQSGHVDNLFSENAKLKEDYKKLKKEYNLLYEDYKKERNISSVYKTKLQNIKVSLDFLDFS